MYNCQTILGTCQGQDARQVVKAIFEMSKGSLANDFNSWWSYQRHIWQMRCGAIFPEALVNEEDYKDFLNFLEQRGVIRLMAQERRV